MRIVTPTQISHLRYWRFARRFILYSALGTSAFLLDLGFIYLFNAVIGFPYYVAVPLGFLIATSLHYLASREVVFSDSSRPLASGYAYFLIIVGISLVSITASVAFLVEVLDMNLYIARVITAGIAGIFSFLANMFLNFKVQI